MVIVDGQRFMWKDRLVFFPNLEECRRLLEDLNQNGVLRVCQTPIGLSKHSSLITEGVSRTICVDLTKDHETLLREMDRTCRYQIRKVLKMRGRTEIRRNDGQACDDFNRVYNDFVRRKRYTYPLSRRRFEEYRKVSDVYVVYLDGRPSCGHLVVRDDIIKRARLIFSATRRLKSEEDAKHSAPLNRYLHWHEFQTYKSEGFMLYDFGGGGAGTSSVGRFNSSFGGFHLEENSYVLAGILGRLGYKFYMLSTGIRRRIFV
jgi:Acetyltransferase (GNAT) domain